MRLFCAPVATVDCEGWVKAYTSDCRANDGFATAFMKKFAGRKSKCTNPRACMYTSALPTSDKINHATGSEMPLLGGAVVVLSSSIMEVEGTVVVAIEWVAG